MLRPSSSGLECDVAATVLGAQVIVKHFTLDKAWPGPDQEASVDPTEFKAMVQAVRHVEAALGDGHKHLTASEAPNKAIEFSFPISSCARRASKSPLAVVPLRYLPIRGYS